MRCSEPRLSAPPCTRSLAIYSYLSPTAFREILTYKPAFLFPHKTSLSFKSVWRTTISQAFWKTKPVIALRRPPYPRNRCPRGPQRSSKARLASAGALLSLPSLRKVSMHAQLSQIQPTRANVSLDFLQFLMPFVTRHSHVYISLAVNTNTRMLRGFLQL